MEEAAVTFLLENLKEVLKSYVAPIPVFKRDIEWMTDELRLWKAFLRDMTERNERFVEVERHFREVIYDAEDAVDILLAPVASTDANNIFGRYLRLRRRLTQSSELMSLTKDRLKRVSDMARGMIDETRNRDGSGTSREKQPRKEIPPINLKNFVGFQDEAETLTNYLMEETEELDVVSIVGMPGIGKTTLAWKIYQSEKIQYEFPTRIWFHVPQEFDPRDLHLKILEKFTSEDMSSRSDHDELVLIVSDYLENEKFLLVIDNVWNLDPLKNILDVFRKKTKRGKILMTSCNNNIYRNAYVTRKPHMLRFLNEKESWELLQLAVFGKLGKCPQRLELIGESVAKNCCGLPLAIVAIANKLLVPSTTTTEMYLTKHWWQKVSEKVTMYVTDYGKHHVSGSLAMSYSRLPDESRHCFLYFGMFPEDYEIPSRTLTRLWIAEGFIQEGDHGQSLEEAAERILDYLVINNLVMVDKTYPDGRVKTCRVHNTVHGFCKSEAAEQNLFQEMRMCEEGVFDPPIYLTPDYRRLCIFSHLPEFLSRKPNGARLRSFLCFLKEKEPPVVLDPKDVSAILESFNHLRVFQSISIKFTSFPIKLTKLIHLRYISLSCDDLSLLPESLSQLWNLETLLVDTQSPSLVIKANIWRMIQLRHLVTKAAIILDIKQKGAAGENLQTLSRLSPEYCTEDVIKRVPHLKTLGIRGQLATLLASDSLAKLDQLEKLKLVNESINASSALNSQLNRLLRPNCFPPNLRSLTLSATYLDWQLLCRVLGRMDGLRILKLKNNAFIGGYWNTDADSFHNLEFLSIGSTDLVSWEASAYCLPRLRYLVLKNCQKLKKIPLILAQSLETLDLENVSESAVESAREIEEEKMWMQEQKGGSREFKLSVRPGRE